MSREDVGDVGEAELPVQRVRVAGGEEPAPQALKLRVREHGLDEPRPKPFPPLILDDEHVGQIRERRPVGDRARESDLPVPQKDREREGMGDAAGHGVLRDARRPVRRA